MISASIHRQNLSEDELITVTEKKYNLIDYKILSTNIKITRYQKKI